MNYPQRWLTLLLVLFLLAGLGGCRSNPFAEELPEALRSRVLTFEDVVRWGALEKMYVFLKPDPDKSVTVQEGLDNVRVTSYELAEPLNQVDETRWRQAARIDYVLTDRQVVRHLTDFQVWETEDEGKTWYRTTPVPVFR